MSSGADPLARLIALKTLTLLHDPPHKSFLIKLLGPDFGVKHEVYARGFRYSVISDTSLENLPFDSVRSTAKLADRIASTFDRWVLRVYRWGGKYLYYSRLHNIHDPSKSIEITLDSNLGESIYKLDEKVISVAKKVNKLLRNAEKALRERGVSDSDIIITLYNVLAVALEPAWFSEKLPPSLADTRVPTHTVFDHLYAATSLSNILLSDEAPRGFYVVIDFPGIQRFVNSGRKVGDFWASSWLLSNVMWGIVEGFADRYGIDVLLMPSPRLNPYSFRYVISRILYPRDRPSYVVELGDLRNEEVRELVEIAKDVYGLSDDVDLRGLWMQPFVPATLNIVLPPVGVSSEDEVKDIIYKLYIDSWRSIYEDLTDKLSRKVREDEHARRYLYRVLDMLRDVVSTPPQGLRVYVLRVVDVYNSVRECIEGVLRGGDIDVCRELHLNIDREKLVKVLRRLASEGVEESQLIRDLIYIITWHSLTAEGVSLAARGVGGKAYHPVPRPFWVLKDGKLVSTAIRLDISSASSVEDWIPCSICGDEPAVLIFRKKEKGAEIDPNEYSDDVVEEISKVVGEDIREHLKHFKKVFKPGEALGPYCLLKRALYVAYRDVLNIPSTDDVALQRISKMLNTYRIGNISAIEALLPHIRSVLEKEVLPRLREKVKDLNTERFLKEIKKLFEFKPQYSFKDVELSSGAVKLGYDEFTRVVDQVLERACQSMVLDNLVEIFQNLYVVQIDQNLLDLVVKRTPSISVEHICRSLGLPTYLAIIKGDADDMGKIRCCRKGVKGVPKLDVYVAELLKSIERYGEFIGGGGEDPEKLRKEILEDLKNAFNTAEELFEALGLEDKYQCINTPARLSSISVSLMLTSVEDYKIVKDLDGLAIYIGGDDVFALAPVQTALEVVFKSRENFSSDGFRRAVGIPITSALVSGRSYSLRFVNLMDMLNEEGFNTLKLLEERSKKSRWIPRLGGLMEIEKDTLTISDSRSGIEVSIPLSVPGLAVSDVVKQLMALLGLGLISRNTPEDFEEERFDVLDKVGNIDVKRVVAAKVLGRNIALRSEEDKKIILERIGVGILGKEVMGYSLRVDGYESCLFNQLVDLLKILRRYL